MPAKAPQYVVDPTQDAISLLIGPFTSVVSFDCKTNKEGESHPMFAPCTNDIRLAGL